jgi:myo-inositol-1-phosphate synthase
MQVKVNSPNVTYDARSITSQYDYHTNDVTRHNGQSIVVTPKTTRYTFRTSTVVPKLGLMLVGIGGNNGTTFVAGVLANKMKMTWNSKEGVQESNWLGSITQASTVNIGQNVYVPLKQLLPMVNPNDLVITGWDISSLDLYQSMRRAQVLPYELQEQLKPHMSQMKPMKGIYDP